MVGFSLPQTWISSLCLTGNPVTVNDGRIFTAKDGQSPQDKITHTQGNVIQMGFMKHVDDSVSLKSCETEQSSLS